jgi:phospholipid/cholesterol/gamma-HCH transport system permease protein
LDHSAWADAEAFAVTTESNAWIEQAVEADRRVAYLLGRWRLENLAGISAAIATFEDVRRPWLLDGSRLEDLDTAAAFLLLRRFQALGVGAADVGLRQMPAGPERLLALVRERMTGESMPPAAVRHGLVERVGREAVKLARTLVTHNAFLGEVALEVGSLLTKPRLFRAKETVSQFETVTIDAIPIVALVTFLIGVVFAYLLGVQAQRYGATIFVVDGVGIAICRELSPILVAVIVAGRSGAAFTAQIGSMKVQEETDAIRTLGLSPIQVLVVPRLVAIMVGLPLLVFVGDLAGIGGGVLISAVQLGISPASFVSRLHAVLPMSAFVVGVAKAPVFAAFIAIIASRMGLSVARDARSVGEHTTSTVVQSIVWVIVLDAAFAVMLQRLGI